MTVTALTLEPAPHGGSEVAIIITELSLDIGFLACDDAAEHAASEHSKATLLGFPEMRPRSAFQLVASARSRLIFRAAR